MSYMSGKQVEYRLLIKFFFFSLQAEREFHLAKNMLIWKTWEPLIEEAPKNQWKWPV